MKNLFTYMLVIILGLPMISKVTVMIQWKLNQQAIADKLCININKPDVMCHGTCVLNERLQNVDDNNDMPLSEIIKDYKFQPFICHNYYFVHKEQIIEQHSINDFQFYQKNYFHLHHSFIFTPPDYSIPS
mgnify:CR=1 FL=1